MGGLGERTYTANASKILGLLSTMKKHRTWLASAANIDRGTLQRALSGDPVFESTLMKIARALKTELEMLIQEDETSDAPESGGAGSVVTTATKPMTGLSDLVFEVELPDGESEEQAKERVINGLRTKIRVIRKRAENETNN